MSEENKQIEEGSTEPQANEQSAGAQTKADEATLQSQLEDTDSFFKIKSALEKEAAGEESSQEEAPPQTELKTATDERKSSGAADDERKSLSPSSDDAKKGQERTVPTSALKDRVLRERKKQDALIAEISELKDKISELSKSQKKAESKPPPEEPAKADKPQAKGETEYWTDDEAPDEAYYDNPDDWDKAMDQWALGEKVVKPAKVDEPAEDRPSKKVESKKVEKAEEKVDKPADSRDVVFEQFENVKEALDDAPDEASDTVTEDFFEMIKENKIEVSKHMLDYMEFTDDVWKIAETFIKKPRVSRRIAKMPSTKQAEQLDSIIKDFGKKPKKIETASEDDKKAPDIEPLRGKSGESSGLTVEDLEDTDFYFKMKKAQDKQQGPMI